MSELVSAADYCVLIVPWLTVQGIHSPAALTIRTIYVTYRCVVTASPRGL